MGHIVQFAINVDDERIKDIVEQSAAKQIVEDIKLASHGRKSYYNSSPNDYPENLKALFQEEIAKYVAEHADEVISAAIAEVSRNIMKTKKMKAALDDLVKE